MTPERQLAGFLEKYSPEIAALMEALHVKMQRLLPGAVRMVYDNYNALVIGFSPSERPSHAVLSIAAYPQWVNLYFLAGASLSDPDELLRGDGKQVRYIRMNRATDLDKPAIRRLIKDAARGADEPFDSDVNGKLVIRAISVKQRARLPRKRVTR